MFFFVAVWFEPTDLSKATKPFQTGIKQPVVYTSPNFNELRAMASYLGDRAQSNNGKLQKECSCSIEFIKQVGVKL